MKPNINQRVAVICQKPGLHQEGDTEIHYGFVSAVYSADDRPYRVDVREQNGVRFWRACAPECIIIPASCA